MIGFTRGVDDVAITLAVSGAAIAVVIIVDRFPPTRALLDRLDPTRRIRRHPAAGFVGTPPQPTGLVTLVPNTPTAPPPIHFFDYERDA